METKGAMELGQPNFGGDAVQHPNPDIAPRRLLTLMLDWEKKRILLALFPSTVCCYLALRERRKTDEVKGE